MSGDETGLTVPCGGCKDPSPHDAHLAPGALERLGASDQERIDQAVGRLAEGLGIAPELLEFPSLRAILNPGVQAEAGRMHREALASGALVEEPDPPVHLGPAVMPSVDGIRGHMVMTPILGSVAEAEAIRPLIDKAAALELIGSPGVQADGAWETPCAPSPDGRHCAHWYDDPEAACCYEVQS